MTQTEVMQVIREDVQQIRQRMVEPLKIIAKALGEQYVPSEPPIKFDIWVAYNEFDIQAIKVYVSWLRCPESPTVLLTSSTGFDVAFTGQNKAQMNTRLGKVKWLGVRFDGDRSRILR